jgi:putative NADPH-quinone reductase
VAVLSFKERTIPMPQRKTTSRQSLKVMVILGHRSNASFSAALADLQFDPILHGSNPHHQDLEPDLLVAQDNIAWVFPVWWGSVPAMPTAL